MIHFRFIAVIPDIACNIPSPKRWVNVVSSLNIT